MTNWLTFTVAVLSLLATPGPTNTLLATAGAVSGYRQSAHLVIAEIIGYMISILTLTAVLGPLVRASPALDIALRLICGGYLAFVAYKLWKQGAKTFTGTAPVKFRTVFVTTLLNPKAIVFAFTILPHLISGRFREGLPYLAALGGMIIIVGTSWIGLGAGIRMGAEDRMHTGALRRIGAVAIATFAVLISTSTLQRLAH